MQSMHKLPSMITDVFVSKVLLQKCVRVYETLLLCESALFSYVIESCLVSLVSGQCLGRYTIIFLLNDEWIPQGWPSACASAQSVGCLPWWLCWWDSHVSSPFHEHVLLCWVTIADEFVCVPHLAVI